jgi:hypothetical protein
MAEKTITLQLTLKCHERVSETAIERVLNAAIDKVRNKNGESLYVNINGWDVEVGKLNWVEAHVTR